MKGKSRSVFSIMVMLYLILSCVCFDALKTDDFAYPSDGNKESTQISKGVCSNIKEDACTGELLGTTQVFLLCRQTGTPNRELSRKWEVLFWGVMVAAALQVPFRAFASVGVPLFADNGDMAWWVENGSSRRKTEAEEDTLKKHGEDA